MDSKEDIKVTVWCLAYNHEKYIRKALEGFVSQKTNFRYEVIVHDDASTDNTASIIREYEEKYPDIFRPIYQTENQYQKKVNKTTNFLLPNARGEIIAFCEGDDYWCNPNKLQHQYDIMCKNKDVVLCVHKVQCMNEDDTLNSRVIPEPKYSLNSDVLISGEEFAELLFLKGGYPFHTSSYFMKKNLISDELWTKFGTLINGDQKILRSALLSGSIYYIDKAYSCRRLMTNGNWNQRFASMDVEKKITHYLNDIKGDLLFNQLSEKKYNDMILQFMYNRLLYIGKAYGANKNKSCCEKLEAEYSVNIDMIKDLKTKLKYKTMIKAPRFYDFIYIIKNNLDKNKN